MQDLSNRNFLFCFLAFLLGNFGHIIIIPVLSDINMSYVLVVCDGRW